MLLNQEINNIIIHQKNSIMKKAYTLMGIALAMGLTAVAAPKTMTTKETTAQFTTERQTVSTARMEKISGPMKDVTSIEDLAGIYKWSCEGHLNGAGKNGPRSEIVTIDVNDATSININFPIGACKAAVNIGKGTVTITNKTTGPTVNQTQATLWYTYNMELNEEGKITKKTAASRIVGEILEDGSIQFPDEASLGLSYPEIEADGSYFYLDSHLYFERIPMNTPEIDGYTSRGTAIFNDGWFNSLLIISNIPTIDDVELECYQSNDNENLIALVNPYADSRWAEVGIRYAGSTGDGYILIDKSYTDMIQVIPLVESGMIMDDSEEEDGSDLNEWYVWNEEGMSGYNGEDLEVLAEEWALTGKEGSTLVGRDLNLLNLAFSPSYAPGASYWWKKWPEGEPRVASVILPEYFSGINSTMVDENATPRYYNLQGIEIANPAKGQLVIVKKGNKTSKFIAR